jgi:hypothetical protein
MLTNRTNYAKQTISSRGKNGSKKVDRRKKTKQSAAIRTWQPWQHSTGAKSAAGKANRIKKRLSMWYAAFFAVY